MLENVLKDPFFKHLQKKRIAVLMGGRSAEREVSLLSGRGVLSALKRMGFDAIAIDPASSLEKKLTKEKIEIAFLALHGRWGEDGTLQGFLEYLNIPYTGSGVHASALAMNKVSSKQVFRFNRIPTAPFFTIHLDSEWERQIPVPTVPDYPLIIKPYSEGSSIGCHVVRDRKELLAVIRKEKGNYPRLFAEKYIQGRELTVGVLERTAGAEAMPVLELAPKREFYDYKAKYTEGMTDFILPAPLSAALTRRVKNLAIRAHEALNCHGYSRTDFILEKGTNRIYTLELNTLPGLTALSDIPAQARAFGLTYDELIYFILRSSCTTMRNMKKAVYHD